MNMTDNRKYWLTTHWPQRKDEEERDRFSATGVWVRNGKLEVLREIQPHDWVFIYETKSGKAIVEKADGKDNVVRRKPGKGGIIALIEITKKAREDEDSCIERYNDGSEAWWRYKADAKLISSNGFVAGRALDKLLGKKNYIHIGFGEKKSGVAQLTKTDFEAVRSAFLASQAKNDAPPKIIRRVSVGGSGEGPIHKSLKEHIAAHPEEALNEIGLRTVKCEFDEFPTGDRIDVLLKDENGRYVTVEVEVDCDDDEVAGPLQCMKYRALIAYWHKRHEVEVRTMLAARSIASSVKKQCENYEIEFVEIPSWPGCPTP